MDHYFIDEDMSLCIDIWGMISKQFGLHCFSIRLWYNSLNPCKFCINNKQSQYKCGFMILRFPLTETEENGSHHTQAWDRIK